MRALDGKSYGVSLQSALRDLSDQEGFVEDHLWTGIGRARSGCGCLLYTSPSPRDATLSRMPSSA